MRILLCRARSCSFAVLCKQTRGESEARTLLAHAFCSTLYGDAQSMLSCLLVSQAAGSAAVDLTNLFLNPQKPSAINVWHVSVCVHRFVEQMRVWVTPWHTTRTHTPLLLACPLAVSGSAWVDGCT
jgi:hypothetical protein